MRRKPWQWAVAVPMFAAAVYLAWRLQADFNDTTDGGRRRVIIETVAMMILAAPLLSLLTWRWGRTKS